MSPTVFFWHPTFPPKNKTSRLRACNLHQVFAKHSSGFGAATCSGEMLEWRDFHQWKWWCWLAIFFLIEKCWLWLGFVKVVEAWNIFGCLNFWCFFFGGLGGFTCQIFAWPMKRKDRIYQHWSDLLKNMNGVSLRVKFENYPLHLVDLMNVFGWNG